MSDGLVIFDCDGVLVDSEMVAAEVMAEALCEIGFPMTADGCIARYTGISLSAVAARIEAEWGQALPPDFLVRLIETSDGLEASVNGRRVQLSLSDPRDRSGSAKNASAHGPQELRALMPGKVVKLLVSKGDEVKAGAGLVIVEAMKMQNEMKAAKDGRVTRIHVNEGSTVAPGETLLVVE